MFHKQLTITAALEVGAMTKQHPNYHHDERQEA
jgi:hypothetical protein